MTVLPAQRYALCSLPRAAVGLGGGVRRRGAPPLSPRSAGPGSKRLTVGPWDGSAGPHGAGLSVQPSPLSFPHDRVLTNPRGHLRVDRLVRMSPAKPSPARGGHGSHAGGPVARKPVDADHNDASSSAEPSGPVSDLGSHSVKSIRSVLSFPETTPAVMSFSQQTEIEVITPTLFFERRFMWTGQGVMDPPRISASTNGKYLSPQRHGPIYRTGIWAAYLINLGQSIPAGDEVQIQTLARFVDEAQTFVPYLGVRVMPSVRKLMVAVGFRAKRDDVRGTYTAESNSDYLIDEGAMDVPVQEVETDDGFEYRLEPESPKPGRYRIAWSQAAPPR